MSGFGRCFVICASAGYLRRDGPVQSSLGHSLLLKPMRSASRQGHQNYKCIGEKEAPLVLEANVLNNIHILRECRELLNVLRDYETLGGFSDNTASLFALFASGSTLSVTISTGYFGFPLVEKLHSAVSYTNTNPTLARETPALHTFISH